MGFSKKIVGLFLLSVVILGTTVIAEEVSKITVAVVDFSDQTGKDLHGIEENSTEILSTLLHKTGAFSVVERTKLKAIITEQGFTMSGLVDSTNNAVQVGKLLGADFLITGSVLTYGEKVVKFKGYGVSTEKNIKELVVNIKVLDMNTGNIEYATLATAQDEALNTNSMTITSDYLERTLLQKALESSVKEITARMKLKRTVVPEKVSVEFYSTPPGADVEINNVFYGNTPLKLQLNPGLHKVKISLANYEAWEKTINAGEGLEVRAVLEKKQEEQKLKLEISSEQK
ncbi:MAG: PEGA domain-containing protein [Firmicutes bacterium]|nr:PEGA domain-containing protein [Bacillota bacterium]